MSPPSEPPPPVDEEDEDARAILARRDALLALALGALGTGCERVPPLSWLRARREREEALRAAEEAARAAACLSVAVDPEVREAARRAAEEAARRAAEESAAQEAARRTAEGSARPAPCLRPRQGLDPLESPDASPRPRR